MSYIFTYIGGFATKYIHDQLKDYRERQKKHQEVLINSLKDWLNRKNEGRGTGNYPIRCPEHALQDFDIYVRQHLEKENPKALELLDELREMYSTCKVLRQNLMKNVGKQVSQKYEELKDKLYDMKYYYIENFKNKVIQEVSSRVEYEQIVIQPTIKTENDQHVLILESTEVARSGNLAAIDKLKEFFNELVQSEEIISQVKEIIRIRREYGEKYEELLKIVESIVTHCEHGHRLSGKCDYCPKFEWL